MCESPIEAYVHSQEGHTQEQELIHHTHNGGFTFKGSRVRFENSKVNWIRLDENSRA